MLTNRLITLGLAAFLGSSALLPALAQTGRIAHFSHGGSAATLAAEEAAEDNFGYSYVKQEWKKDSIVQVNDLVVEHRGQARVYYVENGKPAGPWQRRVEAYQTTDVQMLNGLFPKAKLVGIDKKKKPSKKSVGNTTRAFPLRPFRYSLWQGLAGATGLGAVGWLLGRKRAV